MSRRDREGKGGGEAIFKIMGLRGNGEKCKTGPRGKQEEGSERLGGEKECACACEGVGGWVARKAK